MSRRRRLVNAKRVSRYEDEDGDGILIIIGLLIKLISYATYIFFGVLRSKRMPMKNRLSSGRRRYPLKLCGILILMLLLLSFKETRTALFPCQSALCGFLVSPDGIRLGGGVHFGIDGTEMNNN